MHIMGLTGVLGGLPEVPQLASMGKQNSSSAPPQDEEQGTQGGREAWDDCSAQRRWDLWAMRVMEAVEGKQLPVLKASESLLRLVSR